ncbi:thyroid adenoma-associated protein homolog [Astyanax mexicanus]|uniref:thyroid adenoma-associated protein homolog n=1 Tax=Astyanax mexicanus TaxID=7994 RepID=UPI0020CA9E22|nr:thyroid adenoma-associated protein homolog [Astyanax mexicanus]
MSSSASPDCQPTELISEFTVGDAEAPGIRDTLRLFLNKLTESSRTTVKRSMERSLEEAGQLLRKIPAPLLQSLQPQQHHSLVQLLLALQMEAPSSSSTCRKIDQMLQHLAQANQTIIYDEVQKCLHKVLYQEQVLSLKDLQIVCMFLEDSSTGREVLRQACTALLSKITQLLPAVMKEEAARNGALCYQTVKVCLQVFQLLPDQISPLVFGDQTDELHMRKILEFLMDVILGETSNRDTRLLAGTAVAMLISTATDSESGGSSAWSLLQVTSRDQWSLTVGGLQLDCCSRVSDGVDRLAVARGLLTCCRKEILTSRPKNNGVCLLLDGLFPLISALHREKLDCQYHVFQVFTLWLRSVKECLSKIWEVNGAPLLGEGSTLRHTLTQMIWNSAESPLEGVSEAVRGAVCLYLDIYELDCQHAGDSEKQLYMELLHRISELPCESKAKYSPLSALLPYIGTDKVLEQYPALPSHILKCLSTNHLTPCASEIYKSLLQEQRRELTIGPAKDVLPTELHLANRWAQRWQPTVLKALTSEVTLLQNNASSYLLPCTLRCFPGAFHTLLPALDPAVRGHLRAWTCIMSAQRTTGGRSPWFQESGVNMETLHLALSSLDDSVRLAALSLLCCSPKTKEAPSLAEYSAMRTFLPLNLNSESSPFRQHLQAGIRKFLVRIRDSCLANLKGQKSKKGLIEDQERELEQGVDFVEWLAQLPLYFLVPGNSFQRKKTALLLLNAVLETCSDSWSPDRKKGQPPANMAALISWAKERGQWDFFSRSRQLVLIGCLEDATNEIREQAAELLVRFFPCSLQPDVVTVLFSRAQRLLCSPRVQEAQMGALMSKLLLQKCSSLDGLVAECVKQGEMHSAKLIGHLLKSLEQHYVTAREDMLLAARSSPMHGVVGALQRCMLEVPGALTEALTPSVTADLLSLLEKITLLLLGVLYGDQHTQDKEIPPSFCDMGNAISSLIGQSGAGEAGLDEEGDENVLLSEEHSLVLTCCWVTLKEIGIFLGSLVERILSVSCKNTPLLTVKDLHGASRVFKDIILKCRHWGAVEGCCIGFTKFCAALLGSPDPELREIPSRMLQQGLTVLQSPRATSVTRRAAGLPMLILGVLAAEENSSSRPLLALSVNTLLETARTPLPPDWDQTLDLPQVCAVHTLQTLVKGSSLGLSILQYAPAVAMLSLTLLSSPCWAMRNAALQLYSSLCSRMLGQRPAGEDVSAQYAMSPPAFFSHYPALQPFLQEALERAAADLHESRLSLHPSLYPVLTLLAKLQPGAQEQTRALSAFLHPLLQLAASPVYAVRVMSSRALVAMIPPAEYLASVVRMVGDLPESPESPCRHNRVHGQLLQINTVLLRALHSHLLCSSSLRPVVEGLEARLWLGSSDQRCALVRQEYVSVLRLLRKICSETFLSRLCSVLLEETTRSPHSLELGSASFHQTAVHFLCEDSEWAEQVWQDLSSKSSAARLTLVRWVKEGRGWRGTGLQKVLQREIQANLKEALLDQDVEYRRAYLMALVEVLSPELTQSGPLLSGLEESELQECVELILDDLKDSKGGPELLSQSLCALSLLLSQSKDLALLNPWCELLETHRRAEAPEALRLACAESLALTGSAVVTSSLKSRTALKALSTRLISTGVHLLQDASQQVRAEAAVFAAILCRSESDLSTQSCFLKQINQSLRSLLDLLLRELWESEGILEALVGHLPECDLSSLLEEVKHTQCSSLYEQDEANVFLEPSVISETVLPHLMSLAQRYPESSSLAEQLDQWAEQNAASVRENLSICKSLQIGGNLGPDWLSLLMEPRFHSTLCGLFSRAAFLLQLLRVSDKLGPLLDLSTLSQDLLDSHAQLSVHGVFISSVFIQSVRTE